MQLSVNVINSLLQQLIYNLFFLTATVYSSIARTNKVCTEPATVRGLSLTASLTAKATAGVTLCSDMCPDPNKPLETSAFAGLDNFAISGSISLFRLNLQAGPFKVPLDFAGYKYS